MIYLQGIDFKAKLWGRSLGGVTHFTSIHHLLSMIRRIGRDDKIIFRYQNDTDSVIKDIFYTILLILICCKAQLIKATIYWICHNVDKETVVNVRIINRTKRFLLHSFSEKVFLTDPILKKYYPYKKHKIDIVKMGPPNRGNWDPKNLSLILDFCTKYEHVFLSAESKGLKYKNMEVIGHIKKNLKNVGIIQINGQLLDESEDTLHVSQTGQIDESVLKEKITGIIKYNDDFSVPYTAYRCAYYEIPLISMSDSFTSEFVEHYGIGASVENFLGKFRFDSFKKNCRNFCSNKSWNIDI